MDLGDDRFSVLDDVIKEVGQRILDGSHPLTWTLEGARLVKVEYSWMSRTQRSWLSDAYSPDGVRGRGGWFLPERGRLEPGWISLPQLLDNGPRFALSNARNIAGTLPLDTWECILTWSLTNRLAGDLFDPFEIRGRQSGKLATDEVKARFDTYRDLLEALGIDVGDALQPFLPGHGWSRRNANQVVEARVALRHALYDGWADRSGSLYRALYLSELADRYYDRANADRSALRRRVITKQYGPHLVALFGGDWLALLDYLGEQPHPDEEVVYELPVARIDVDTASSRVRAEGREEAGRGASTALEDPADSPIASRIAVLTDIWSQFDQAQANQQSGMRPLPSLETSEFRAFHLTEDEYDPGHPQEALMESVLRGETIERVNDLWGMAVFERWPERLHTEVLPFNQVAKAVGPAWEFWEGVERTIWYVAEGPYSRTDVAGLSSYYSKLIKRLDEVGNPIDVNLFTDLARAEKKLGPPEDIEREMGSSASLSITMRFGQRREGFEFLRDVVTQHRRSWMDSHLQNYLQRWRRDLEEVHGAYHRRIADIGKPPTLRQFSRIANRTANSWFGGDLGSVYAAIGEKRAVVPKYDRLMPENVAALAQKVFRALGGRPLGRFTVEVPTGAEQEARASVYRAADAARGAIRLIQCREAKGAKPTIAEFGTPRWRRFGDLFGGGESGWDRFIRQIDEALTDPTVHAPSSQPETNPWQGASTGENSEDTPPTVPQ
ncbi:MAG: hypothetical protein WEA29_09860 [Acidimicrobiia bacterium]